MWGSTLPELPITQEQVDSAFERACVKSEMRGHKLIDHKIEPRFCCVCEKITWFLVALEQNGIGYQFSYKHCITGQHDTVKERWGRNATF